MTDATPVEVEVATRIRRRGPIPFSEVVELALYHPEHGFYAGGVGRAGRRGDFLTSPEVGPLFGAVLARAIDAWWIEAGSPDRFTVVEAAAGTGTMARAVLAAHPASARALTYVLVERAASMRRRHGDHLPLVDSALAFGPGHDGQPVPARRAADRGPRVVSLGELPAVRITGVVLANELLDNLAFGLLERGEAGWTEVYVGLVDGTGDRDVLTEVLLPASDHDRRLAERLAPDAAIGSRIPSQHQAGSWLASALSVVERGRVIVIDYAATTSELAARPTREWLRTYRGHGHGLDPLEQLGRQDITCDVAIDQLAAVREPDRVTTQAAFLGVHGIETLVEEGRRIWRERAAVGDLEAVRARSRVGESEALLDPEGLGGFRVLEWSVR
ncbi:MAG TPA: SAM-dependent methyltransferase [Acidimicrobiales bacterium]|nr:SAM-dependent methyltransferase [Acidimicrobiales bacterium]